VLSLGQDVNNTIESGISGLDDVFEKQGINRTIYRRLNKHTSSMRTFANSILTSITGVKKSSKGLTQMSALIGHIQQYSFYG